ncbi:MAG: chorismate-binding protein, partial [Deltaproteobacteria bacterium]|nr:chorismate-binding protein [Deltaproteobacteria bacterium]
MISFSEFAMLAKKGNLIPLFEEIPADLETPVSAFLKIRTGDHDFLLESAVSGEKWGRYSFLGTKPSLVLRCRGSQKEILRGRKRELSKIGVDALDELKKIISQYRLVQQPGLPRFAGGAVGFLSYDMVRYFEKIPGTASDPLSIPDATFMITDTLVAFDNFHKVILVIANVFLPDHKNMEEAYRAGCRKIRRMVSKISGPVPKKGRKIKKEKISLKPAHSEEEFCRMVEKVQEYIKAGDVFQTVISTRFAGKTKIEPFELYRAIRNLNPSPYLFYLEFGGLSLVGASPEVMVRLTDHKVELRPIAGTRKRGKTAAEEEEMERELKSDPKELAEHVMLVDLGRNDLGRVCKAGSVVVDEREVVERYSHVMHLVSHVSGELKEGCDSFDVIRAAFPAGTLTGAPKVRAMEIIEELEGVRRGAYGGCVGYVGFDGNT